ncbi:MAG: indolepyruvate ferredoxin oxidoreductase subunit alpha [Clostridiales bacterium]|nr:indolepyruvate ferredoxin oxidoreductase subunit alpha [Clostridiales bacterium]
MSDKIIMLGNEAIARGAYEAGVKVASSYPGTPSTEISEFLAKYDGVYAEWAPNEKVALEAAFGASVAGVRALSCMKHVGLNVACDPLFTISYIGVNGGLVIVVADDPGIASSQNEQDTRMTARAAHVPVLEPSDSGDAKEFIKYAYELSEKYDTPIILRTTTKLSHSQSVVELGQRIVPEDRPYVKNTDKYVMMPREAVGRHVALEQRENRMQSDCSDFPINRIEKGAGKMGVITSGICYQYVKEALPDADILKLGIVNPLPKRLIEQFSALFDEVLVVEELEPVIEEQVKSWGINAKGKELFTKQGEYSAAMLKKAILGRDDRAYKKASVPARPPILCPGCPHRSVFSVLKKLGLRASGDIGCYTLGAVAPLSVSETTVCMGASISVLHGMERAKGKDYIKDWVAVIGDSTFLHTGVNSLVNMVYNKSTATVIILDNRTTGMTGHQDHPATGKTLKGESTYAINLVELCKAIGVPEVYEINAFDYNGLSDAIGKAVKSDILTVIIAKSPCALLKGQTFAHKCIASLDKCKKCGMCLKIGCPAITKGSDGAIVIDGTMCNGCGLCVNYCKFGAIERVDR